MNFSYRYLRHECAGTYLIIKSLYLVKEYQQTRLISLIFTLIFSFFALLTGETILSFFGDYENAQSILLILIACGIVKVGYGPSGRYLNMAGYATTSMFLTFLLLLGNFTLCFFLIPKFLGIGAALSTLFV